MSAINGKVLLVKPDYKFFPMGIAYIVESLRSYGIDFDFIDALFEKNVDLNALLSGGKYAAVATGGLIGSYPFFKSFLNAARQANPTIPLILGGNITVDVRDDVLFSALPMDYAVIGEGETTFPELLLCLDRKDDPRQVKGLAIREGSATDFRVVRTGRRPRLDLAERNHILQWDFINLAPYKFNFMPILSGRGCSGRCAFCSPTNGRFRSRPLEHIFEEIEYLNTHYDTPYINFINEVFFPEAQQIKAFCEEYKKITPRKEWGCLLRMDVEPWVLKDMKEAGCRMMNVGVESGSDRILGLMNKDITTDAFRAFIPEALKNGIIISASYLMGSYGETKEDLTKTIDLMMELKVRGPSAMVITYPGTLNYHRACRKGLIKDEKKYLEEIADYFGKDYSAVISGQRSGKRPYLHLSAMSDDELMHTVEWQMRRYFTANFRIEPKEVVEIKEDIYRFTGECPLCKNRLEKIINFKKFNVVLSTLTDCCDCGRNAELYFHPSSLPQFQSIYHYFVSELNSANKIFVLGTKAELHVFFRYNFFDLDFSKIAGVIIDQDTPEHYVYNHLVYALNHNFIEDGDLIIVLNELSEPMAHQFKTMRRKLLPQLMYMGRTLFDGSYYRYRSKNELFDFLCHQDIKLYIYAGLALRSPSLQAEVENLMEKALTMSHPEFNASLTEVRAAYDRVARSTAMPRKRSADVDLGQRFLGMGWGRPYTDVHGTSWRFLGPDGEACTYLYLKPNSDYILRSLVHTAKGDSQERLEVYVNGVEALQQHFLTEGTSVFHECRLPREALKKENGLAKIVHSINGGSPDTFEQVEQFALIRLAATPDAKSGLFSFFR